LALPGAGLLAADASVVFEPEPRRVVSGRDPQIAVRASGELFLLKVEDGNLWLHASFDGGDSFEAPIRVNGDETPVSSHAESQPQLRVRGMREFYVVWQSEADGASKLLLASSVDWGQSFSKPVAVDSASSASQSFFNVSVSPQGHVYVAWLDGRDRAKTGGSAVYQARSTDRGSTFQKSVRVGLDVCPCCRPSIAFSGSSTVHVSWRSVFANNVRDMVVATSNDGGQTWGDPLRVAEDNWSINGCPHSGAAMATLGDRLFISWHTVRDGRSELYLAYSDDGGRTFSSRQSLAGELLSPNHSALVEAGDKLAVVFQARDGEKNAGWSKAAAYFREIDAAGGVAPLIRLGQLEGSASYPTLTWEAPGQLFVVWTESFDDGPGIVLVRGRRKRQEASLHSPGSNAGGVRTRPPPLRAGLGSQPAVVEVVHER
jgi:hypothetical protein